MHLNPGDEQYWDSPVGLRRLVERPTNNGVVLKYIPMRPDDHEAPGGIILRMPPGYVLYRHAHECPRIEVVLGGSLDVGGKTMVAGSIMTADSHEMYGPHVAGPEGCTTVEFFETFSASWKTIYSTPRGPIQVNALDGDLRPSDAEGPDALAR